MKKIRGVSFNYQMARHLHLTIQLLMELAERLSIQPQDVSHKTLVTFQSVKTEESTKLQKKFVKSKKGHSNRPGFE